MRVDRKRGLRETSASLRSWLGSYTNPMSAAEATASVHKQQRMWQPVLDEIAKKQPR